MEIKLPYQVKITTHGDSYATATANLFAELVNFFGEDALADVDVIIQDMRITNDPAFERSWDVDFSVVLCHQPVPEPEPALWKVVGTYDDNQVGFGNPEEAVAAALLRGRIATKGRDSECVGQDNIWSFGWRFATKELAEMALDTVMKPATTALVSWKIVSPEGETV